MSILVVPLQYKITFIYIQWTIFSQKCVNFSDKYRVSEGLNIFSFSLNLILGACSHFAKEKHFVGIGH